MCKCTPNIRTPFCGHGDCVWPHKKKEGTRMDNVAKKAENKLDFKDFPNVTRKMKYFGYSHLPEHMQPNSKIFYDAAMQIVESNPVDIGEAINSLSRLIEAKDCFVRSMIK